MVINELDQLIRVKAAEWGRKITYKEIARETGLAESTVARLKSNSKGIRYDVLDRLCAFFDCTPGDILRYEPSG